MKLKHLVFTGSLFFASTFAHAKWAVTRTVDPSLTGSTNSWSALERSIETSAGPIKIAIITNSVVAEKKDMPQTEDEWAEQLRSAMKSPPWIKEKRGKVSIYTVYWKEQNRFLRFAVEHGSKYWMSSLANVRQPYVLLTSYETDLLQAAFFKIEESSVKTAAAGGLYRSLWLSLVAEAEAGISLEDLSKVLRGFEGATQNIGLNSAKELANGVAGLGGKIESSGIHVESGMNTLAKSINGASNAMSESMRKAVSFQSGFTFGGGLGIGISVGEHLGNFILDGAASVFKEMFYFITKNMKPEEKALIEARAGKAFEDLNQSAAAMKEAEMQLALYGTAISRALQNPSVNLLEQSESEAVNVKSKIKQMEDRLSSLTSDSDRLQCSSEIAKLGNQLVFLNNMKAIYSTYNSKEKICDHLKTLLDDWKLAEVRMTQAKMTTSMEMLTLLGDVRMRAVQAISNPVADDKRLKRCDQIANEQLEKQKDLFKAKGCTNNSSDFDCQNYAMQMELSTRYAGTCKADQQAIESSLSTSAYAKQAELANDNYRILRARMNPILQAECRLGEVTKICEGAEGNLTSFRKSFESRQKMSQETCGGQVVKSSPLASESLNSGLPNEAADLKMASGGRTPQAVEEKPGLFASIWNGITGFFRRK